MLGRSVASHVCIHALILLCGHSKTQLSRSIIGQLGHHHFTIWLNAGSYNALQESLRGAAISLKDELLRTEVAPMQSNATQDRGFFYPTSARIDYLVELLTVWLSMAARRGAESPRVLVILDDVDGLEPSALSKLSKMVSGDGIDVIFNTRDPTIADQTSYMDATNFDVPPLHKNQAQDLLYDLNKRDYKQGSSSSTAVTATSISPEMKFLSNVASSLGCLPAALVDGSHYLMVNLTSLNSDAVTSYLNTWNSPADRMQILQFHRPTSRYPHSMQASFKVSMERLQRNTKFEHPALYLCCLGLLRLLSALKIVRFARFELESLRHLLGSFVEKYESQRTARVEGEEHELPFSLRLLSEDPTKAPRCADELVRVSLLTMPDGSDTLVLNQLIIACVELRTHSELAADRRFIDPGLYEAEMSLLQEAADHVSEDWEPCSSAPRANGHVGL